jgi:hypothetical protein
MSTTNKWGRDAQTSGPVAPKGLASMQRKGTACASQTVAHLGVDRCCPLSVFGPERRT